MNNFVPLLLHCSIFAKKEEEKFFLRAVLVLSQLLRGKQDFFYFLL